MKAKYSKYINLGGIDSIYKRFYDGEISLPQIAGLVKYSVETVRNNLLDYKGRTNYQKTLHNRSMLRKKSTSNAKIPSNDFESYDMLLDAVENKANSLNPKSIQRIRSLISIAKMKLPQLNTVRLKGKFLIVNKEVSICLRIGITNINSSDYNKGIYRFKPSENISQYDYCVFSISNKGQNLFYIFPTHEIVQLKTLSLRFKLPLNRGKYAPNLNNWSLIKN